MGRIGEVKARRLLRALKRLGFVLPDTGATSHRLLRHPDGRMVLFTFHEGETVGPRMLAKIAKDAHISLDKLREAL